MRLSTVILPIARWNESREKWQRAEELGFYAAYTYDHLSWARLNDRPWFPAVPTLVAASRETTNIRLGTLVTTPNFRHPVPFAKELLAIDDLSNGRLLVGLGSGGLGNDASVLAENQWSAKERSERFAEFVELLDQLLTNPSTTFQGNFYSANDALSVPGPVQTPRPPFVIAAHGRKGMAVAARFAQGWVSTGRSRNDLEPCHSVVRKELELLDDAMEKCTTTNCQLNKLLLDGLNDERPLASLDAFVDWAGRYQELGITELVIHWPEPGTLFESDTRIFEDIATHGLEKLTTQLFESTVTLEQRQQS
ncbi:MAG: LLM class flavin-dependent oxidoreductase [Acidimicrobiales bacterium]